MERRRFVVRGVVQGVGFRPFVWRAAAAEGLAGWVANGPEGVTVEAEGPAAALERLAAALARGPGPARVEGVVATPRPPEGRAGFAVRPSRAGPPATALLPDLAPCPDCLRELFDPADRRHRYPFLNCTACGPRYSILRALPWYRGGTAMRGFPLCPACRAEYEDPADRRFHAEPVACPDCGPRLELRDAGGRPVAEGAAALAQAVAALCAGRVVAVLGAGGFQLMADATDPAAVADLRRRKARPAKPLAVMVADLAAARALAEVSAAEAALLAAPAAPIVLLEPRRGQSDQDPGARGPGARDPDARDPRTHDRRAPGPLAPGIAPACPTLGLMLPSTPLHHLVLRDAGRPLVATSGNPPGAPIATDAATAPARLAGLADLFLLHDRPVLRPLDDSVARVIDGRPQLLRRARGYAPLAVAATAARDGLLALGGHQKAAVALAVRGRIVSSQHLGDLDDPAARDLLEATVAELAALHGVRPRAVVHDTHPDYATTGLAAELGLPARAVQHHLAHVMAVVAEHGLAGPVLGLAWDGTGHGADGTVWGGEAIRVEGSRAERVAHLRPFPLPGGAAAVREPRRAALGLLHAAGRPAPAPGFGTADADRLHAACAAGAQAPPTTSIGRLFDAVAALAGLTPVARHEGEAALALEATLAGRAGPEGGPYPLTLRAGRPAVLDWVPMLAALLADRAAGAPAGRIAARFHAGLAAAAVAIARRVGVAQVVLTGGCFQNRALLTASLAGLRAAGFRPVWAEALPPGDGGLAAGQLAWAARQEEADACALQSPER